MKLFIASIATTVALSTAASAMVSMGGDVQPRDAALGSIVTMTTGDQTTIDANMLRPREQEQRAVDTVNLYTFNDDKAAQVDAYDLR